MKQQLPASPTAANTPATTAAPQTATADNSAVAESMAIASSEGMSDIESYNLLSAAAGADAAESRPTPKRKKKKETKAERESRESAEFTAMGLADAAGTNVADNVQQANDIAAFNESEASEAPERAAAAIEAEEQARTASEIDAFNEAESNEAGFGERTVKQDLFRKLVALHEKADNLRESTRGERDMYENLANEGLGRDSEKLATAAGRANVDAEITRSRLARRILEVTDGNGTVNDDISSDQMELMVRQYGRMVRENAIDAELTTARAMPTTGTMEGIKQVGVNTAAGGLAGLHGAATSIPIVGDYVDAAVGSSVRNTVVNSTAAITGDQEMAEHAHNAGKTGGKIAGALLGGAGAARAAYSGAGAVARAGPVYNGAAAAKGGTEAATGYALGHEGEEGYELNGWQRMAAGLGVVTAASSSAAGTLANAGRADAARRAYGASQAANVAGAGVDAATLSKAGYRLALVGTALMGNSNPGLLLSEMVAAGRRAKRA